MLLRMLTYLESTDMWTILSVLGDLMQHAKGNLVKKDWQSMKTFIFTESKSFKTVLCDHRLDESSTTGENLHMYFESLRQLIAS